MEYFCLAITVKLRDKLNELSEKNKQITELIKEVDSQISELEEIIGTPDLAASAEEGK